MTATIATIFAAYGLGVMAVTIGHAIKFKGSWQRFAEEWTKTADMFLEAALWPIMMLFWVPYIIVRYVIFGTVKNVYEYMKERKIVAERAERLGKYE
jgi:hypothetical protein